MRSGRLVPRSTRRRSLRGSLDSKVGRESRCAASVRSSVPDGVTVAIGQSNTGPSRSALDPPYGPTYGFEYRGMGGMVTNLEDLWNWDRAMVENKIVSRETLDEAGRRLKGLGR